MWPGLAGVHADQHARRGMLLLEIRAKGASRGVKGGVVERRFAGFPTNTIGTEELFRHDRNAVKFGPDREAIPYLN